MSLEISKQELQHICRLLVLGFRPDEAEAMRAQLSQILDSFSVISEVKMSSQPLTADADYTTLRDDTVGDSLTRETVLQLAPAEQDGYIKIKRGL